jgi:Ca-activated chloride channel family protein
VEQLLRLQTRVWSDPSDPAYRYFKVQILRNGIEALPVLPRELVYLIDCSASMTEEKLQLALQGVRASLDQLSETDVFRIAAFRNEVTHMRAEPVQATVIERARAKAFLSELHAYGKTDVYSSLEMLLQLPVDAGRPLIALLVTDGVPTQGMMDSREILDAFTRANRGRVSVFGVGGGDRVNRLLLDFLSYRNRGQAWVTGMPDGIPGAMLQMEKATARPVLMDLRYRFTRGDAVEVYPRELSHLYLDSPLVLIGRAPVDQTHIAFQMIGQSGGTSHDLVFELDLSSAPRGNAELRREWAWQAVLQALSGAEQADPAKQADRIRALADTYNLDIPAVYRIVPPAPFL